MKKRFAKQALSELDIKIQELKQQCQHQYELAKSEDQVTVMLDQAEYLDNVDDLAQLPDDQPENVKDKKYISLAIPELRMVDFKLNKRGPSEDETYALDVFLVKNIRRGNTVIEQIERNVTVNVDGKEIEDIKVLKRCMGRKGLTKFFDLQIDFLDPKTRYLDAGHSPQTFCIKNQILSGALKAFVGGHNVEVFKTLKANGENAQVSYNTEFDVWVVASKNVGIVVRNKEDLAKYHPEHFRFSYMIGMVWLNKIEDLMALDPNIVTQLKKEMAGKTLVAEFIGSPEHQHMVKYNQITLIFYAIVDNNSSDLCWPVDQALNFFKKYQLNIVKIESQGLFNNYDMLCNGLYKVFRDVAKSKIVDDEEGSVLYLVKRDKSGDSSKDKVLSLAKLKTIEYRVFRKIREKLRGYYRHLGSEKSKKGPEGVVHMFQREMNELIEGNELPQPIQLYIELLKSSFEFIDENPEPRLKLLNNQYINFQEELIQYHASKNQLSSLSSNLFESNILDKQDEITYEKPKEVTIVAAPNTNNDYNYFEQTITQPQKFKFVLFCPYGILNDANLKTFINENFEFVVAHNLNIEQVQNYQYNDKSYLIQINHIDLETVNQLSNFNSSEGLHNDIKFLVFGYNQMMYCSSFIQGVYKDQPQGYETVFKNRASLNKMYEDYLVIINQILKSQRFENFSSLKQEDLLTYLQKQVNTQQSHGDTQTRPQSIQEEEKKSYEVTKQVRDLNNVTPAEIESQINLLKNLQRSKKTVIVIIPFGITGSGKTTLRENLSQIVQEKLRWNFKYVSSDEIRKECMDKAMQNGKMTRDEAFDRTGREAIKQFDYKLQKTISDISKSTKTFHVVFVDKNHPKNGIAKTVGLIHEKIPDGVNLKKLYLIPRITQPYARYPLSLGFLMQCFYRLMSRENHETLDNSDKVLTTQILLMFFHLYIDVKFKNQFLQECSLDGYFNVPMTYDDQQVYVPDILGVHLERILRQTKKGDKPQDLDTIQKFINDAMLEQGKFNSISFSINDQLPYILDNLMNATEATKDDSQVEIKKIDREESKYKQGHQGGSSKFPLYIGITLQEDPEYSQKLVQLYDQAFKILADIEADQSYSQISKLAEQLIQESNHNMKGEDWKLPADFHVTLAYYKGMNEDKKRAIQHQFKEEAKEDIIVEAVVYVKDKVLTALCFPKSKCENKCPHITLLLKKQSAKFSNIVLEKTCLKAQVFNEIYEEVRDGVKQNNYKKANIKTGDKELDQVYFIKLQEPIVFKGVSKSYYH
ncbi:UNKNOWN [Stylonychia lemnae]|uniref:Uncharacterized protein n=1 Tax=Stylonychia lemnae TaxID=5949 RepID=A0A078B9V4_STYLE|nr:UNKNOWN [Stylonychia lemnae]|eukprot:CDW91204.1 UNKNOWN [Stylonychia lemnae]